ncbi:hypothetical protein SDRG_15888 [Saprolegnia diclina VS20]|uniref:Uncharacterized protein n=1 Tax=Saprolegnia diclina (strain VS20) TaxID=1156394 RepID=T0PVJ9_SAPDV|nr:hypothetical protein SDRG_15888 [Saprolegnia diclina VS20]EQC26301.1 hypothetical protein SDRG_15888 [Saprolegnia diclina VS20]|eukprot:XP_008620296.1 hypothetical protein SDRG_15888 [Saprolegnia diclina VS20]
MVEYAQREPFATRGQIQAIMYALMGSGGLMARFFNQFFLNGARYGGNYDFSAGPNVPYWMGVGMALAALTCVLGLIVDSKKRASHDLRTWSAGLWTLLTSRVVFQLLAFRFAFNLFAMITGSPIYAWVTNLDMGWINITPRMLFVPATIHYGRFALQWNWRRVVAVTTVSNIVLMALATFFVIYDVSRNAWVFTALFLLTGIPVAITNLVTGFAMVEMAGVGYEAVIAGLWATIRDLNVPIANKVRTSLVDEFPAVMSMKNDSHTHNQVAYPHIIGFSIQVVGLIWLVLLPSQKTPLAMMKSHGASRVAGVLVVLGYVALVTFSWQQALEKY